MTRRLFVLFMSLCSAFAKASVQPVQMTTVLIGSWEFDIPVDWNDTEETGFGYLESSDGSIGCYIKSIVPTESKITARALSEDIQTIHETNLRKATKGNWQVVARNSSDDNLYFRSQLDMLDETNKYRVLSLVLASPKDALQVTIHNYLCENYTANRDEYRATELSLRRSANVTLEK
jgi:hypothetical protein